jgi:hypothetical protein
MMTDISPTGAAQIEARKRALSDEWAKATAACEKAAATLSQIVNRARQRAGNGLMHWAAVSRNKVAHFNAEYIAKKLANAQADMTKRRARAKANKPDTQARASRQLTADVKALRTVASVFRAARKLGRMTANATTASVRLDEIASRCRASIPAKDIRALIRISHTLQTSEAAKARSLSELRDQRRRSDEEWERAGRPEPEARRALSSLSPSELDELIASYTRIGLGHYAIVRRAIHQRAYLQGCS